MQWQEAIKIGIEHCQARRFDAAERTFRHILSADPRNPHALHQLGLVALATGRRPSAADLFNQAITAAPDASPAPYLSLAEIHLDSADPRSAESHLRKAITLAPNMALAHFGLGVALRDQNRLDEAAASFQQAIALDPRQPAAHINLGATLRALGRLDDAAAAYRRAIDLAPNVAAAHANLGNLLRDMGRPDQAAASFNQALALQPDLLDARVNLGLLLADTGRWPQALPHLELAAQQRPADPRGLRAVAIALSRLARYEQAVTVLQQVVAAQPRWVEPYLNLGDALRELGRFEPAIAALRQAVTLKPDLAPAHNLLGACLKNQGLLDDALTHFRRAMELDPRLTSAHSNYLGTLIHHDRTTPAEVLNAHRQFAQQHEAPLLASTTPHSNDRSPDRRLRIGYISPDFRTHPVAVFMEPVLTHHDPSQFEIFCYPDGPRTDQTTTRLQALVVHWKPIAGLSDQRVSEIIREDQIDILVDLAGHTSNNRLLVFARKPAPVQVTYLGYPGTTGLSSIDHRLTDANADPPEADAFYSEKLTRLPDCFACYRPDPDAPPVTAPPALTSGAFTFGCLNNSSKITPSAVALWSRILKSVDHSRLLLSLRGDENPHLLRLFEEQAITADRLILVPRQSKAQYLHLYDNIDLALDPFPFSGHTTTCDALWQGVPAITLLGHAYVSRLTYSVQIHLGLSDFAALNPDHYAQLATDLARNPARLAQLRPTLRDRMRQSPLLDAPRFTRDLEAAYRKMWRTWAPS